MDSLIRAHPGNWAREGLQPYLLSEFPSRDSKGERCHCTQAQVAEGTMRDLAYTIVLEGLDGN